MEVTICKIKKAALAHDVPSFCRCPRYFKTFANAEQLAWRTAICRWRRCGCGAAMAWRNCQRPGTRLVAVAGPAMVGLRCVDQDRSRLFAGVQLTGLGAAVELLPSKQLRGPDSVQSALAALDRAITPQTVSGYCTDATWAFSDPLALVPCLCSRLCAGSLLR